MHLIAHGHVLSAQFAWVEASILIDGERIAAVGPAAELAPHATTITDARDMLVAPGLIDVQINGAWGHDFTAVPASVWQVARRLPQWGITSFLPTIITAPRATITEACAVLQQGPAAGWHGARPLGLHLEGPFINPQRCGAHPPQHIRSPDPTLAQTWHAPTVRLVTLAPELDRAAPLIDMLGQQGVVVNAGHSQATYAEAQAGFAQGIRGVTHIFNAMTSLHQREPGLAVAALDDPRCIVGVIPDGVHVHPAWLRMLWRVIGPQRLCVVTDAMAAVGMPPGTYALGDSMVVVDGTAARLHDGRLAGSILKPLDAIHNLCAWTGCSLAEALGAYSATPARLLGCEHEYGSLAAGAMADLLLLTSDGTLQHTFVAGRELWNAHMIDH